MAKEDLPECYGLLFGEDPKCKDCNYSLKCRTEFKNRWRR